MSAPSPDKKRMDLANQIDQSRLVKQLRAEKSSALNKWYASNRALAQLEEERDQLKKDLLNLLPIARGNAYEILSSESFSTGFEVQCERYIEFFDELTAKYAEGK